MISPEVLAATNVAGTSPLPPTPLALRGRDLPPQAGGRQTTTFRVVNLNLTPAQQRVLGALVEKRMTTPDHYPLSTNALISACNQSSNRDPVVDYDETTVIDAMNGLRELDLARTVKRAGERAIKHLDRIQEGLDIDEPQAALLAVLLLRGSQTPGELRTRTARYHEFELEEVELALTAMQSADIPTVRMLPRRPGEREARWQHTIGEVAESVPASRLEEHIVLDQPTSLPGADQSLTELRAEIEDLKSRVQALEALLGE